MKYGHHKLLLFAQDAKGLVKDPKIGSMGERLCRAVNAWCEDGRPRPVADAWFRDAETLVRSKYVWAMIPAALCAGVIAPSHPDSPEWLLSLFQGSRAKARMFMLRFSTVARPRRGNCSDRLITAGLTDRTFDARLEACAVARKWRAKEYLPLIRKCLAAEAKPAHHRYVERECSMLEKGYWLDTEETVNGFDYWVPTPTGTLNSRISKKPFESMSEKQVMRRVREAAEDYRSDSAKWLHEINGL